MARRGNREVPRIQPRVFTSTAEIDRGMEKLRRSIENVRRLRDSRAEEGSQVVKNVEFQIQQAVREVFGENSPEYGKYQHYTIWFAGSQVSAGRLIGQPAFEAGIPETIIMLEGLMARLEDKKSDLSATKAPIEREEGEISPGRKVFVVHERDEAAKQALARCLEKLDLEPIILHERPSEGRTIIEKFEKYADVAYAVVLLTGDDRGGLKEDPPEQYKPRPRQNVVLELGFFLGKLGRNRVCPLYEEGIQLPSDYAGVVYVPLDPSGAWKLKLAQEMKAAGLDVDLNKLP